MSRLHKGKFKDRVRYVKSPSVDTTSDGLFPKPKRLHKVTGTAHDGLKVVRMPPRYFFSLIEGYHHLNKEMESGIVWIENKEGSRNRWSSVYAKNIEWPKGARA